MAEVLVGRTSELALVSAFVERARTGGEALLLFGEPGAGKTALLDAAAATAAETGTWVLRSAGVEFEAGLTYSGLHQVLLPVFGQFGRLSAAHRDALNAALGLSAAPSPSRLLVSAATLTVLRQAAARRPVLVIIDDLPWLDRASAGALGFAARRLTGSRVGILAASRPGQESFFERAGLPRYELGPLDEQAAETLVRSCFPDLAPGVRQRVMTEAQGNPLALLELPTALSSAQRAAAEALPAVLPLSRRLQTVFASRISDLPGRTRQLLLLAALNGAGDLRVLEAAAGPHAIDSLAPAEQAGLVRVDEQAGRLVFRHPLTRSAIVELSTSGDRRRAHRALADHLSGQPELRASHLAAAAARPDEEAAGLLEQVAHRLMRRGDATGAVTALLRAADLSPDGPGRSRRLTAAAYVGATLTMEIDGVPGLLAAARSADPERGGSLPAAVTAAHLLLNADGDIDTVHRLLVSAIEAEAEPDHPGEVVIQALHTLMAVCYSGGRAELWTAFQAAIDRLAPHVPADLLLLSRTIADPARIAAPVLAELDAAVSSLPEEPDHWRIMTISAAAVFPDRLGGCREALLRVVRDGRAGGAVTPPVSALTNVCLRRARATTEARAQLTAALEIFEGLNAKPWAARAASELRATGRAPRRDGDSLTPQELEIAELAAAGLSNKEIGQRLFLSHRTVGAHLYQIFPKLGVTSRAALRDALASLPPEPRDEYRNYDR